jgi:hypothetical protein
MTVTRSAAVAAFCLGLALVPTVLHSYAGLRADDGLTVAAIPPRLAGFSSRATDRRPDWVQRTFDSTDWLERRYAAGSNGVLLFAARSFDAKRLYHHPELAIAYGYDLDGSSITRLPAMPEIPVHVLRPEAPTAGLALYALLYDDAFVGDPYLFQLRMAGTMLFSPKRAMTLFFVHDPGAAPDAPLETTPAAVVLLDAIRAFRTQAAGDR